MVNETTTARNESKRAFGRQYCLQGVIPLDPALRIMTGQLAGVAASARQ